jgi:hypothetical protein
VGTALCPVAEVNADGCIRTAQIVRQLWIGALIRHIDAGVVAFALVALNRALGSRSQSDTAKLVSSAFVFLQHWTAAFPPYLDSVFYILFADVAPRSGLAPRH